MLITNVLKCYILSIIMVYLNIIMVLTLLVCYSIILICFCIIFNPVICCLLPLLNSVLLSSVLFFCIVYLGGVYMILLFVSAQLQNESLSSFSMLFMLLFFIVLCCWFGQDWDCNISCISDFSSMVCGIYSQGSYIVLVVSVLLTFFSISSIVSSKSSILR